MNVKKVWWWKDGDIFWFTLSETREPSFCGENLAEGLGSLFRSQTGQDFLKDLGVEIEEVTKVEEK